MYVIPGTFYTTAITTINYKSSNLNCYMKRRFYCLLLYISDELLPSPYMFCVSYLQHNCTNGVWRVTSCLVNEVLQDVTTKSKLVIRSQLLSKELPFTMYLSRSLFPCNYRHRHIYTKWQGQYTLLHSHKEFCCIRRYLRILLPFETMRKQHASLKVIIIYVN